MRKNSLLLTFIRSHVQLLSYISLIFAIALIFLLHSWEFNAPYQNFQDHLYQPQSISNDKKIPLNLYVNQNNYERFWTKSTFPTRKASIEYHTKKHGHGRSPLQYTRDAISFHKKYYYLRRPVILKDGNEGYKIRKGERGGTWTKSGKIVTFWG